ncbi:MAG TPA: hypothetical protein VI933_03310 [archaeon]|nr:hypothetical protein [archaeon]
MKNFKGAVFTIDALFALFLASATFLVISQSINYQSPSLEKQNIFFAANDLLSVMQNDGTLVSYAAMSQQQIESDLETKISLLPENFCGNLTVSIYKYQSGDFSLQKKSSGLTGCAGSEQSAKAKRVFYDSSSQQYGVAEMGVWLK